MKIRSKSTDLLPRAQSTITVNERRLVELFVQASIEIALVQTLLKVRHLSYCTICQVSLQLCALATFVPQSVHLDFCNYFALVP